LYAREHGKDIPDLPIMVEQVWLAQKQVDIICSEDLREALKRHADALNEVARHEADHPDWWEFVSPHEKRLRDAMRAQLTWPDVRAHPVPVKSAGSDQEQADRRGAVREVNALNEDLQAGASN
jgi:hypothetical protein